MSPWDSVWKSFSVFYSSMNAQKYLLQCYKQINLEDSEKKSYENCYPFIYYLDHGKSYYQLSQQAPISIKPILLFYGMVQLIKACLLTVDPAYPESSSVLAHGVTTRKRKKQNYEFLKDEVKIQKNGLFSHMAAKMFHVKHNLDAEKYTMEFLLARIPEVNPLFEISLGKQQNYKIGKLDEQILLIPSAIMDHLHMTSNRFQSFMNQSVSFEYKIIENENEGSQGKQPPDFHLQLTKCLNPVHCSPIQFDYFENTLHIPVEKEQFLFLPEMMTHYLLLYNLSMIARYETEWWSELLHGFDNLDYPFIEHFLSTTTVKIPYLIQHYLQQRPE